MKKILVCWLLAAACGGGSNKAQPAQPGVSNQAPAETAPRTAASAALDKMEAFTTSMCACKDKDCAQKVSDDMVAWSQEMAKKNEEPPKMTDDDSKRASDIGRRMGDCMQRAMLGPNATPNNAGATP